MGAASSPGSIEFQETISKEAHDFICALLTVDPEARLGSRRGASEVREHPWLNGFDWTRVSASQVVLLMPRPGTRSRLGAPPEFDRTLGEYPPSAGESGSDEDDSESEED